MIIGEASVWRFWMCWSLRVILTFCRSFSLVVTVCHTFGKSLAHCHVGYWVSGVCNKQDRQSLVQRLSLVCTQICRHGSFAIADSYPLKKASMIFHGESLHLGRANCELVGVCPLCQAKPLDSSWAQVMITARPQDYNVAPKCTYQKLKMRECSNPGRVATARFPTCQVEKRDPANVSECSLESTPFFSDV